MKNILITFLYLCFAQLAFTQLSDHYVVPKLYMGSTSQNGTNIEVAYEITVPGFVELHLIDPAGKKIWIKGFVKQKGNHVFKIPTEPMKKNEKYEFLLKYKGKEEKGWFYSPT